MTKKQKKKLISSLVSVVVVAICIAVSAMTAQLSESNSNAGVVANANQLEVYFLDVGQGDSELIKLPDGKNILIDSGEKSAAESLIEKLNELDCTYLDYVVVTHPHTDHMGGMAQVLGAFDVGELYMPRANANTKAYEKLLTAIKQKGLKINTAKAGKVIYEDENTLVEILSPLKDEYDDLNNYSAVIRLEYGKSSFLFTGDAEKTVELDMLDASPKKLDVDVLKVGHHGSRYSSSKEFLTAVTPDYAIIEVGSGNDYGHPHSQAVNRLQKSGAEIYRTDLDGDICISTRGDGMYYIDTQK